MQEMCWSLLLVFDEGKSKIEITCAILLTLHRATRAVAAVSRHEGRSPTAGSGRVKVWTRFLIPSAQVKHHLLSVVSQRLHE